MATLTLAAKDMRLLLRDPRSAAILLLMPVVLILVLGLALGEGFGQKPDDRLRISVVNLDAGVSVDSGDFPPKRWSEVVIDDLAGTGDIRVEIIDSREEAERLVRSGKRAAVIVFEPEFSERAGRCSFLSQPYKKNPINPLFRDGVRTDQLGLTLLRDPTQPIAAAIIEQVTQVTLLRVVIPFMIGQAFDWIGKPEFMAIMEEKLPAIKGAYLIMSQLQLAEGIKGGIATLFSNYNFTAKTWAGLTRSEARSTNLGNRSEYVADDGSGPLKRGAVRYQVLVPSYTVTFAFFLVLTVGWLFVTERTHGTLVRLRAAPLFRWQILLGKLIPCLAVSLFQGFFLLAAGKLIFGMSWGVQPWLLAPVVASTSFAAVGLAMLVASVARSETQVAVYGTLLVLVLGGISGSLMPRDLMPESMKRASLVTPHAWALDAYSQVIANPAPEIDIVFRACTALIGFGIVFLLLAWWRLDLE